MGLPGSRPLREVESRFSRALSPGGSHVSSSPALPDGGPGRGGLSRRKDPGPEERRWGKTGWRSQLQPGWLSLRGGGGGGPQDSPEGDGADGRAPGRRFPAPRLPLPGQLEREGKPCPTTAWDGGGQAASTPVSGRSQAAEQ